MSSNSGSRESVNGGVSVIDRTVSFVTSFTGHRSHVRVPFTVALPVPRAGEPWEGRAVYEDESQESFCRIADRCRWRHGPDGHGPDGQRHAPAAEGRNALAGVGRAGLQGLHGAEQDAWRAAG